MLDESQECLTKNMANHSVLLPQADEGSFLQSNRENGVINQSMRVVLE